MPQRRQITWAQLRVGILIIVSFALLAVGIFFISGEAGFLSRKYTLKTYFSGASGLRQGAQLRLAGIPVGIVEEIRISPFPDPRRAVEVVMRLPRTYQNEIRTDSQAKLATAGLLGEAFVDITRGQPDRPVVPNGGVIPSSEEADIKRIVENTNDVISNLRVLSEKLNDVTTQVQSGRGALGKLIYDVSFYNRLNETLATAQRLMGGVEKGQGTLGKLLLDDALYQRTLSTVDRLNQMTDAMQNGKGSMGKFINDPSVYDQVREVVAQANTLVANVNNGKGTLGKIATDPQLYNRMNETFDRVNAISTRIEQGQGTLGKLSTDETLYKNLNTSSESLREFLTEFRKNPKKYLTLRLRLF